jgi:signal transduction histidine kinase
LERQDVLIVDDDDALAENVAEILGGDLPVNVEVVGSAGEARALIARKRFDLVFSDVRLPDGDGTTLVEPIRARWPNTEVVLITGDASVASAMAAVQGGAFAYVLKPLAPREMLEIARRALAQAAAASERERLQNELRRSELRHRTVVEAVPALVLALDAAGRIALWNRRLEEATGYCRDEMIGQPGEGLIGEGGVHALATKGGSERMVRWERARVSIVTGGEPPVSSPGIAAAADNDGWTYAVGTDVTAEQEMLRRTLRAERLAAVGTLAAGLAHEVRNPLNSALLQLQVLRRRLGKGDARPETIDPVAVLIEDEIRRLERLVDDFLSFARPRPLDLQPTGLAELCRAVLAFAAPEAEGAGIAVELDVAPDLPSIQADPTRLRQVLQNLVRNALEAMPHGGRLTLRLRRAERSVEIDVADTGEGFADEAPVFDAFFTTKSKGTGLGLSIVHGIVTDHGGTMRVRSHRGDTCFTVVLPA